MSEGQPPSNATFYKIESSRFTMREYSWGTKNPIVLIIASFLKLFRVNLGGSIDDPATESIAGFEVGEEALPEDIRAKFAPIQQEIAALGFARPIFHAIEDRLNFTTIYWATYAHTSGRAVARVHCRIWRKTHPHKFHLFPTFISLCEDGTAFFSSSGKPDSELPKTIQVIRNPGQSASELWRAHEMALHRSGKQPAAIPVRDAIERFHVMARDFHLKRGAFARLREEETRESQIFTHARGEALSRGAANPEVLAEIELLQKAPRTWKNGIWLAIITGLAFVLAGGAQGSLKTAALLIPILFFHELGHYVAMHIFKYRNLKMFFIPFLGAAVTGQNYNVAAWKKVVVFLMGPVPGILLGAGLAIAGAARGNDMVTTAGLLCIVLNAFNLLPLLPLDGGHVVSLILFSRHHILDVVFRVLAGIGLIVVAYALDAKLLMYFGIFSLLALGTIFKQSKVTEAVRAMNLPGPTPGTDEIPPETADAIVTELKKQFPKGLTSKHLAERALAVSETLNARPPGWAASIFFLGVHAFALVFGVLAAGAIFLHRGADLFGERADMTVNSRLIEVRLPEAARDLDLTNSVAIVASFDEQEEAGAEYKRITAQLPTNAASALFGQTVYLRLPATNMEARATLFDTLSQSTTNLFLERTNYRGAYTFQFSIKKDEQNAPWFRELQAFCDNNGSDRLVPPWTESTNVSSEAKADFAKARVTMSRVLRGDTETFDPKATQQDNADAHRFG